MAQNNQLELFTIPNPCIGVCQSNARGYCIGCLRSREERFNWHLKSEQEQRKIIQLLAQRKSRLAQQQKHQANNDHATLTDTSPAQNSLFESSTPQPAKKNTGQP